MRLNRIHEDIAIVTKLYRKQYVDYTSWAIYQSHDVMKYTMLCDELYKQNDKLFNENEELNRRINK